jgi:hypothetical protein
MDYFMFFLGVFSVLFVISLALSFANYLSSVKLKNDVDSDTRNLDDRITSISSDIFNTIHVNEISVENRLKDSINYNVSLIDDINNRINRIEDKLDGIIASQKSNQ